MWSPGGAVPSPRKFLIITNKLIIIDDVKGPQHYIKHLKITLLVLLWYNSDVSFPILGYRYLNKAKISWAIGGGRGPRGRPSKYAHEVQCTHLSTGVVFCHVILQEKGQWPCSLCKVL